MRRRNHCLAGEDSVCRVSRIVRTHKVMDEKKHVIEQLRQKTEGYKTCNSRQEIDKYACIAR